MFKGVQSSFGKRRKRALTNAAVKRARALLRARNARAVVPGFTRTGGYYGRFAGRGGELKFFDTTFNVTMDTTAEVLANTGIVLIPQGVTESTRIGRKCTIKQITIRGYLTNLFANNATSDYITISLIQDTQANGAYPAITDIYDSTNLGFAFRYLANSQRFKVIKTWRLTPQIMPYWDATGGVVRNSQMYRAINWTKKCNIPIEYSSTTGAITELKSNNLFLVGSATGNDDLWTLLVRSRVRFSDSN